MRIGVASAGLIGLTVALATSRTASADPCRSAQPEAGAPARLSFGPAGFGSLPEACPATEASLQGFGTLLVAMEDFYGLIDAGLAPRARLQLSERTWISAWLSGFEYRYSANATVEASSMGLGAAAVGFHHAFALGRSIGVAPFVRVLYPMESGYLNATRYGFDHGLSAVAALGSSVEAVGGVSFPALLTLNGHTLHTSYSPTLVAEAVLKPFRVLSLLVGAGLRLRSGDDRGFDGFDPRVGLRLFPVGGLRVELGAAFPVGGRDRTDLVGGLNLGWIFEPR
jgi:hypothetical protein